MKKLIIILLLFFSTFAYSSEQMVEIAIEITEKNENEGSDLGIETNESISIVEGDIPAIIKSGTWVRGTAFFVKLNALKTKGMAKVLSKPKLATKSGTSANFMVGGEFPFPVSSGVAGTAVQWKKYGIIMDVTPTITKDNRIDIIINTELSRIDQSNGFRDYPLITKSYASSNLQIKDGETIVLAGLKETSKGKKITGIPFLRDIPFLGALFGSTHDVERKTDIFIFVTPKLI
ncbi:hypothetical protein AGMMS49936_00270 [Endomicrobiia bacterium]|nr:hypothetical protein AGMMS49936_00270 [Endomicrobiia bacterium]